MTKGMLESRWKSVRQGRDLPHSLSTPAAAERGRADDARRFPKRKKRPRRQLVEPKSLPSHATQLRVVVQAPPLFCCVWIHNLVLCRKWDLWGSGQRESGRGKVETMISFSFLLTQLVADLRFSFPLLSLLVSLSSPLLTLLVTHSTPIKKKKKKNRQPFPSSPEN